MRDDFTVGVEFGLEEQVAHVADRLVAADGGAEAFREDGGEDLVWMEEGSVNIRVLGWGVDSAP